MNPVPSGLHAFTVSRILTIEELPAPPAAGLSHDKVYLRFVNIFPGDAARGFVPYYHFRILVAGNLDVGHINFRVGDTAHVRTCAGHIGYEISEPFRGHGFAGQACRALAPFARDFYAEVTITCDPANLASKRTIEKLGARFVDEVLVPPDVPPDERGARAKVRYRWALR